MVQVQPPEDWDPGEDVQVDQTAGPGDAGAGPLTDFDDIESVLTGQQPAQAPVHRPRPKRTAPTAAPRPASPRGQSMATPRPSASASQQPMLPDQQWTSTSAQRRKRAITIVATAMGALVIIGALVAAWLVNWSGDDDQTLAQKPVQEGDAPAIVGDDQNTDTPESSSAENPGQQPMDSDQGLLDQEPLIAAPIEQQGVTEPGETKPPEIEMNDNGPGFAAPTADNNPPEFGTESEPTDPGLDVVPSADNSFAGGDNLLPNNLDPVDPDSVATLQDELGDLASLLESSDTSLRDLEDQASRFGGNFRRVPKFFVDRPPELEVDLERQLGVPLPGLIYEQPKRLTQMARTMSRISSIPITIDVRQLELMQVPVNPEGMLTLTDTTMGQAIDSVAAEFELDVLQRDDGLVLTRKPQPGLVDVVIELPEIEGVDDAAKRRFIASIKTLIAPEIWVAETNPASLELVDGKLSMSAPQVVVAVIRSFVAKLGLAAKLAETPDDLELRQQLASRWSRSAELRDTPVELAPTIRQPILKFLQRIENETGATVTIDWLNAAAIGWNLLAEVPGDLSGATVEATIQELAAALDLVPLAVDEETFFLTTRRAAEQFVDLEVYPVVGPLARQAKPGTLEKAVFEALGEQVQTQLVKVVYEPKCQCLIAVGNQAIQRQIEGMVTTLNQSAGSK